MVFLNNIFPQRIWHYCFLLDVFLLFFDDGWNSLLNKLFSILKGEISFTESGFSSSSNSANVPSFRSAVIFEQSSSFLCSLIIVVVNSVRSSAVTTRMRERKLGLACSFPALYRILEFDSRQLHRPSHQLTFLILVRLQPLEWPMITDNFKFFVL